MVLKKTELHRRNPHRGAYDFNELIKTSPALAQFVRKNPYGVESINFADPLAVKTLNKAILLHFYHLEWDIPNDYLCPPIPGRADYIHHIADLLTKPKGNHIRVLDIGVGANAIYPLIGHKAYGWSFVGTDIDPQAISIAKGIIKQNGLSEFIELRLQKTPQKIFEGVVQKDEAFDLSMCNPPFHTSAEEAKAGTARKNKNLGIKTRSLNFGGKSNELWCPGGEVAFITRMIEESVQVNCRWFTTYVSKATSLPPIYRALKRVAPAIVRTIDMSQGQKKSRIVAWTFVE